MTKLGCEDVFPSLALWDVVEDGLMRDDSAG